MNMKKRFTQTKKTNNYNTNPTPKEQIGHFCLSIHKFIGYNIRHKGSAESSLFGGSGSVAAVVTELFLFYSPALIGIK